MLNSLQTEYFFADSADFTGPAGLHPVLAGPQFASPWRIESVLYMRETTTAMDIILSVLHNGIIYDIDVVSGSTDQNYVFPNIRVPHPIALSEKSKITFRTVCFPGKHYLLINWSQIY